jgi:uncharacterized protein (TIGR02118 family)
MVTYLALWTHPTDVAGFEREYTGDHLPLAQKLPGVRRVAAAKIEDGDFYRVVELDFDTISDLRAAMSESNEARLVRENSQHLQGTYGVTVQRMIVGEWEVLLDGAP